MSTCLKKHKQNVSKTNPKSDKPNKTCRKPYSKQQNNNAKNVKTHVLKPYKRQTIKTI